MALVVPGGPQQVRDGVGVAGREMGPPLWANVFTLQTVNTAVQYSSQTVNVRCRHGLKILDCGDTSVAGMSSRSGKRGFGFKRVEQRRHASLAQQGASPKFNTGAHLCPWVRLLNERLHSWQCALQTKSSASTSRRNRRHELISLKPVGADPSLPTTKCPQVPSR